MLLAGFFQIVLLLLAPLAHIALGRRCLSLIQFVLRRSSTQESQISIPQSSLFVVGLLAFLVLTFLLRLIGLPWMFSLLLIALPLFDYCRWLKTNWKELLPPPSINFALWFAVIWAVGISLFNAVHGIQTVWVNNFGDLTFHIGMITSFVWGDNFPPQYHIFAGETLSYPFLINLWSAALWWINPSFRSLALIFFSQWVVVWIVIYFLLNGNRFRLLPWAVLFGGGTFAFVFHLIGAAGSNTGTIHSGMLINEGYPWCSFLTTIWVTQRATLLGMCALLSATSLFHATLKDRHSAASRVKLILAGITLSLSALAHTHFFLVGSLYILLVLLSTEVAAFFKNKRAAALSPSRNFLLFSAALLPSLLFLPWIVGKSGIVDFSGGWMPWKVKAEDEFFTIVAASIEMWVRNAPFFLLSILLLWFLSKRDPRIAIVAALFLFGNFIKLSAWPWDQIKYFLALYLVLLSIWSTLDGKAILLAHIFPLFLMLPSVFEAVYAMYVFQKNTVFSVEDLKVAKELRSLCAPNAIVAAAPDHNSPVTLSGRRLFYGYEGTLWSHGIVHKGRREVSQDFERVVKCRSLTEISEDDRQNCPDYILWTDRERRYWKNARPDQSSELQLRGEYLYRIKGQNSP